MWPIDVGRQKRFFLKPFFQADTVFLRVYEAFLTNNMNRIPLRVDCSPRIFASDSFWDVAPGSTGSLGGTSPTSLGGRPWTFFAYENCEGIFFVLIVQKTFEPYWNLSTRTSFDVWKEPSPNVPIFWISNLSLYVAFRNFSGWGNTQVLQGREARGASIRHPVLSSNGSPTTARFSAQNSIATAGLLKWFYIFEGTKMATKWFGFKFLKRPDESCWIWNVGTFGPQNHLARQIQKTSFHRALSVSEKRFKFDNNNRAQ